MFLFFHVVVSLRVYSVCLLSVKWLGVAGAVQKCHSLFAMDEGGIHRARRVAVECRQTVGILLSVPAQPTAKVLLSADVPQKYVKYLSVIRLGSLRSQGYEVRRHSGVRQKGSKAGNSG